MAVENCAGESRQDQEQKIVYTRTSKTSTTKSERRYKFNRDSSLPPLSRGPSERSPTAAEPAHDDANQRQLLQQQVYRSSQNDLQLRQQNYHDNSGGNNAGKVKLVIAPDNYGSRQQKMVRSATIGSLRQQQLQPSRQQRSQQQQQQQQLEPANNRSQKNYHHYDYYTDSDLTSSAGNRQHHYDENILLFATEHGNSDTNERSNGNQPRNEMQQQQQQQPQQVATAVNYSASQPVVNGTGFGRYHSQTGRFVNYYPSWRQTQSPTNGHHQNYSFHLPLQPNYQQQQQQQLYQSRYGFVAPAERVASNPGRLNQSFKSRTISHIPNMVKVSVDDSSATAGADGSSPVIAADIVGSNYEDFYDRPSISTNRQFMMSEGDLLKVHRVNLTSLVDEGYDNPFKPGTELSWEADMMVRLMKRGYPIEELPVLVETAKQVARETSGAGNEPTRVCPSVHRGAVGEAEPVIRKHSSDNNNSNNNGNYNKRQSESRGKQQHNSKSEQRELIRRQSSTELNLGKQVWANSLGRTKSMPRFTTELDADSIDKLITNIENEMSELLNSKSDLIGTETYEDKQEESPTAIGGNKSGRKPTGNIVRPKKRTAKKVANNSKSGKSEQEHVIRRESRSGGSPGTRAQPRVQKVGGSKTQTATTNPNDRNKADLIRTKEGRKRETGCCRVQ